MKINNSAENVLWRYKEGKDLWSQVLCDISLLISVDVIICSIEIAFHTHTPSDICNDIWTM